MWTGEIIATHKHIFVVLLHSLITGHFEVASRLQDTNLNQINVESHAMISLLLSDWCSLTQLVVWKCRRWRMISNEYSCALIYLLALGLHQYWLWLFKIKSSIELQEDHRIWRYVFLSFQTKFAANTLLSIFHPSVNCQNN